MKNKLKKDSRNSMMFGVCAGLSDYFNIDVIIFRLIFTCGFCFISGNFVIAYFILALVMPSDY